MAWLHLDAVAFAYARTLFSDVSFRLENGRHGLVGANGAGKSTLLALIAGTLAPTDGHIRRSHPPGSPAILLLDEPTNDLDARSRDQLIARLKRSDALIIIASHDRAFLDAVTESTLRLHHGTLTHYRAPYARARALWEGDRAQTLRQREQQVLALREAEATLQAKREAHAQKKRSTSVRGRMRNAHDSDARTLLAQTKADWAESKAGRSVTLARRAVEKQRQALTPFQGDAALGRSLFVGYQRSEKTRLLTHGSLVIERETRIRITGEAGTSALFQALARSGVGLFVPRELGDEAPWRERLRTEDRSRWFQILAALGVAPDSVMASARWSPGELRKLTIAWGLARQVHLIGLDEPTSHIDLPSVERLERALAAYPGALILVTRDDTFAAACRTVDVPIGDLSGMISA